MRIVWSPTARRRALDALDYIAADRPGSAAQWFDDLIARVNLLREFPNQGHMVPEWVQQGVRQILYAPYRVIYEVSTDSIEILTLSHDREAPLPRRDRDG